MNTARLAHDLRSLFVLLGVLDRDTSPENTLLALGASVEHGRWRRGGFLLSRQLRHAAAQAIVSCAYERVAAAGWRLHDGRVVEGVAVDVQRVSKRSQRGDDVRSLPAALAIVAGELRGDTRQPRLSGVVGPREVADRVLLAAREIGEAKQDVALAFIVAAAAVSELRALRSLHELVLGGLVEGGSLRGELSIGVALQPEHSLLLVLGSGDRGAA